MKLFAHKTLCVCVRACVCVCACVCAHARTRVAELQLSSDRYRDHQVLTELLVLGTSLIVE